MMSNVLSPFSVHSICLRAKSVGSQASRTLGQLLAAVFASLDVSLQAMHYESSVIHAVVILLARNTRISWCYDTFDLRRFTVTICNICILIEIQLTMKCSASSQLHWGILSSRFGLIRIRYGCCYAPEFWGFLSFCLFPRMRERRQSGA